MLFTFVGEGKLCGKVERAPLNNQTIRAPRHRIFSFSFINFCLFLNGRK